MADITIVNGVYKHTYNWGAPSCTIRRCITSTIHPSIHPSIHPLTDRPTDRPTYLYTYLICLPTTYLSYQSIYLSHLSYRVLSYPIVHCILMPSMFFFLFHLWGSFESFEFRSLALDICLLIVLVCVCFFSFCRPYAICNGCALRGRSKDHSCVAFYLLAWGIGIFSIGASDVMLFCTRGWIVKLFSWLSCLLCNHANSDVWPSGSSPTRARQSICA